MNVTYDIDGVPLCEYCAARGLTYAGDCDLCGWDGDYAFYQSAEKEDSK